MFEFEEFKTFASKLGTITVILHIFEKRKICVLIFSNIGLYNVMKSHGDNNFDWPYLPVWNYFYAMHF